MKKSSRVISTLLLGATLTSAVATNVFAVESKETIEKKLLAGNNRYETAVKVSEKWEKADNVVLVNALAMADALAATPLAKLKDAPILLTDATELTKATKERIEKLGAKNVFVVGGEGVVSKAVVAELEKAGLKVERISGVDRFETSAKVAKELNADKVAVVNGLNGRLADALSVAAPAAENNMAILLTNGKDLGAVKDAAKDKEAVVVGGSAVVADSIKSDLKAERLGGANRNETNAEVMKKYYGDKQVKSVYVAKDGAAQENQLVDALAAGPVAGKEGAPIVLAGSKLADGQKKFLEGQGEVATVYEVGGGINTSTVKDLMTALGVKDVVDKAEVASVKATNLKEVVVTFGMKVDADSAEDKTNYSINKNATIEKVELAEDGRTAVITVDGNLKNQDKYKLTVDTVLAGDKEITAKDYEFTPIDNTLPEVKEVVNLGTKAVKVVFTEPIKNINSNNVKLDGKSFYGSINNEGREVILTPHESKALEVGDHKLEVEGAEDYATLKSLTSEHKFTVVEDKTAPTVVKTDATLERVKVTFSEDVDPETVSESSLYYKKDDKKVKASRYKKVDGKTYTFYFDGEEKRLPGYEMTMYVEDVKDYSGNVIKEKEIKVKPEVDQTRPVVRNVSVSSNGKVITVKFSKNIDKESLKPSQFVIKDENDKIRGISDVKIGAEENIVEVTLYEALPAGKNTIKISGVKDATYLKNVMLDYEKVINTKDTEEPDVAGISTSDKNKTIIITFDKKMDPTTLDKISNYAIGYDANATEESSTDEDALKVGKQGLPSDTEITVVDGGKSVRLVLPEKIDKDEITFGKRLKYIEYMGLKDAEGNWVKGYSKKLVIRTDDKSKARLTEYDKDNYGDAQGIAKDRNTIKLRFEQTIGKISTGAFELKAGTSTIDIKNVKAEGGYVTITTEDKLPTATTEDDLTLTIKDASKIETSTGLEGVDEIPDRIVIYDLISPEIDTDELKNKKEYPVDGNKIIVPFTENIKSDNDALVGLYAENFKVTQIGTTEKVLKAGKDYTTTVDGKKVIITVKANKEYRYKVELVDSSNGKAKYIQDGNGNFAMAKDTLYTNGTLETESSVKDAEKAKEVDEIIKALPAEDDIKLTDKANIVAARNAYNGLTDAQKALVTNISKLEAAEAKITELEGKAKEEADKAAAKTVVDAIEALPAKDDIKLTDEANIGAARNAYNGLTDAQKALVTNLQVLIDAEAKIAELK
ncbi:cell wall-binding repeat-containing protein [Clostridium faecium]|uniref:Cell wall-binding repeat-containing protein n=1 Tax=Clostridium faecium TaxID=2762223 RepID=A0ABR8YVS4_9CLOT|nr:cell wall-binding repeat-containing protein [Clostridium faecium]MBD8048315.1 cell wall-binding repeat-containing protein [Clostridium faecium]